MRAPLALVVFALFAGCLGLPAGTEFTEHAFGGVFLATVLPGQIYDIADRVLAEGGDFESDGKIPPRFIARGLTQDGCEVVRTYSMTKLYIEKLDRCAPVDIPEDAAPSASAPRTDEFARVVAPVSGAPSR